MKEEQLFHQVLELAADQRAAFLDAACQGDGDLRKRVEGILWAHSNPGSFLQTIGRGSDNSPTLNHAPVESPGLQIGPYKLLQQIGEGGMGTVYMAEQTQPVQRKVALKVIKQGMDSREVIARFEAERQALAMMDHVNIARVLDAGTTKEGRPYFVMELVHGVPITKYCDDNQLTPRERVELFLPVCQAIQHAHQKGIIHRDIKPSNVMVTLYDGKPVPKVIDFGVAKATEQKLTARTLFTHYGTMVGTLEYMSPEQAEMSALGVDTRSDIYSLGVLLYELLTGSTPLNHQRMKGAAYGEILRIIKEEEPPTPSTRVSNAGETLASISALRKTEPAKLSKLMRGELDWIVMKSLEKDRNRRYETANAVAADVRRYLNDEPVQACPPSAMYRFRKFARRNIRVLVTTGLVALALVSGTVVSAWQAYRATIAERLANANFETAEVQRHKAQGQLLLTEQAQNQGLRQLYEARLAEARSGALSRRIGQRYGSLKALAEAAKISRDLKLSKEHILDLRNAAIACLILPDLKIDKEWSGWPTGSMTLDFDGALERYARADRQGAISIRRVADDAEIYRLDGMGPGETWSRFSSDGRFLALWRSPGPPFQFQVWDLSGPKPVMLLNEPTDTFAFSPDGRQLARALPTGSVRLHELSSGREIKQIEIGQRVWMLAFHPQENRLAVSCAAGVQIRDLETDKLLAELAHPAGGQMIAWHPDGKTLAVDGGDRIVHTWDVAARQAIARMEGHKNGGIRFAFNHSGDVLASSCWDGTLRLWNPRTGQQLFHTPAGVHAIRFSSDDRRLAAGIAGDKLQIWEVAAANGYRTLVRESIEKPGYYYNCAIHPNGQLLVVGMLDGFDLWDLATGKHLASIKSPTPNPCLLFEQAGVLVTSSSEAHRRWPVQANLATGEVRIGPPQLIPVPAVGAQIASSADGQVLASAQFDGALVLHRNRPEQLVPLRPHADVRLIAVSPDGRWVATGSHSGTKVIVWNAQTGKPERELPVETGSNVCFSPNGKWLATTGDGCRLWRVDSWEEGPQIGGGTSFMPVAFSNDGELLAVETGNGVVRLVSPDTGREYARLVDPNQDRAGALTFSPDGTQLVTTSNDSQSIHVWDLRAIRTDLARMGLDWELPPYEPAGEINLRPLTVEIISAATN